MPSKRHSLPEDGLLFDIVWEPGSLGGSAHAVVDVLRLINRLARLKSPTAAAPMRWRWVGCDGNRVAAPAGSRLPENEAPAQATDQRSGPIPGAADVIVIPGWMARDGPELDQWVKRCSALLPRLRRTLAQGGALLGIYTGVSLLAAAGCLGDRRFAAPWPFFVSMMRQVSAVHQDRSAVKGWSEASDWINDRCVWTCATPVASTAAALDLISCTPLADLANAARDVLMPSPLRQGVAVAHALSEAAGPEQPGSVPSGIVERARRWLVRHLAEPYDPVALSRAAATSPRTLARHFLATHGVSAYQYLERLRVERACQLLQTTYVPVEEIGRLSGLSSPTTFRRVFVRHTGELPGQYRRRYSLRTQRPRWSPDLVAPVNQSA